MKHLTQDLSGGAVYLDNIQVSGTNVESQLQNLRWPHQKLKERGLRSRESKCCFVQSTVKYLEHKLI